MLKFAYLALRAYLALLTVLAWAALLAYLAFGMLSPNWGRARVMYGLWRGSWDAFGDPRRPLGRSWGAPSHSVAGRDRSGRRWGNLRRPGGASQQRKAAVSATTRAKTSVSGPSEITGPRGNQIMSI